MKKIEFLVLHLGYGGIENAVSNVSNLLKENYEVSILSLYRLYENPIFPIDSRIKITYLYDSDVPLKVKKYNALLKEKQIGKLFQAVWKDYGVGFHGLTFFHDFFVSIDIYFLKGRFRRLKKYLKKDQKDVYISTRWEISKYLSKFGNKNSKRYGWEHNHYHGNENYKKNLLQASKNLDALVLVSQELTLEYQKELKNETCKCYYIPNMISYDLPFVSDYSKNNIMMIGRLEKEKGLMDAILVAKRLQEQRIPFQLNIIGDGTLRESLEQAVREMNLTSFVTFHGFQNHDYIENLMKDTSLYLMTSFTESFGLVLVEAMNAGIPCIAFDSAEGARDLIQHEKNGILIPNRDLNLMTENIVFLLQDKERLKKMGQNAKHYSKFFLGDQVKQNWLWFLEDRR